MFDFLRKKTRSAGSVLFRGSLPVPFDRFRMLESNGIELEPQEPAEDVLWSARARHRDWGEADLYCPRATPYPSRDELSFDRRLTEPEVELIVTCASSVIVEMRHAQQNVLRERKLALRFMHAVMGEDGVSIVDHGSGRFWSRSALDEELATSADLDIESLFILHSVSEDDDEERNAIWLHSHGLAELGFFDFDILDPSPEFVGASGDLTRALAFGITEGRILPDSKEVWLASPDGVVSMVPVEVFERRAHQRFVGQRDDPLRAHATDRSVICEPAGGFFSNLFKRSVEPSHWLRSAMDDSMVVFYSNEASQLMGERARATYPMLRRYTAEFERFSIKTLVKIGLPVDGATDSTEMEHLWFEASELLDESVKGLLLNEPWHIASLQEGQEYTWGIDRLSDWTIFTPVGSITPREGVAVRLLRERGEEILDAMRRDESEVDLA